MSLRQMRGVTGINPKRDWIAQASAQSATLPALKQVQYNKDINDRSLALTEQANANNKAYYDDSLRLQEDALAAQKADYKRGLMLQGGMVGVNAYNALDDAGAIDKGVSVAKGLIGAAPETITTGGDSLSGFAGSSANSQMGGYGLMGKAAEYGSDIVSGVGQAAGYVTDAGEN